MKNGIAILILLVLMQCFSYAQTDPQWLIRNGLGKSGWNVSVSPDQNEFGGIEIEHSFSLFGIKHPPAQDRGRKKNDIFIIYEDGNYYSSRSEFNGETYTLDPFYPGASGQSIQDTRHNFSSPYNSNIEYLYLTNIYEEDDPPEGVGVKQGNVVRNSTPYTFGITNQTMAIQANHDIVEGKDIVLILKREGLQQNDTLSFNESIKDNGETSTGNYFTASPVSGNMTLSTNWNTLFTDKGNGSITFNSLGNAPYVYVNLTPTNVLPPYSGQNSNLNSRIIFRIKRGQNNIASHEERVLSSHDPNEIKLERICAVGNETFVYYRIGIQNTGEMAGSVESFKFYPPEGFFTSQVKINRVVFPNEVELPSVSSRRQDFYFRNAVPSQSIPVVDRNGRTIATAGPLTLDIEYVGRPLIEIAFGDNAVLDPFDKDLPKRSQAYIWICLKLEPVPNANVSNSTSSYRLVHPVVTFGNQTYRITSHIGTDHPIVERPLVPERDRLQNPQLIGNGSGCNCFCDVPDSTCLHLARPGTFLERYQINTNNKHPKVKRLKS